MREERSQWGSRMGFILAAAGAAVGLGNVWKFPYITGANGGGAFVLVYLLCIALIGLPIMIAEVMLGRMSGTSNVSAFKKLSPEKPLWQGVGWLGVAIAFLVLSYYSVVAGWALDYTLLAVKHMFTEDRVAQIPDMFTQLAEDGSRNVLWHAVFMSMTIAVVVWGIKNGIEKAARVLMPTLLLMMLGMLVYATTLDGFGEAFDFVFGFETDKLKAGGVLEALGHAFFTLSVGMGAMLTYGSYLSKKDDIVGASVAITVLDTLVALMACLVLFPITFSTGQPPNAGPGLVFMNMPVAFAQLPGGYFLSIIFFLLIVFAALTSAVSLLEVAASYLIDEKKWPREKAVLVIGTAVFLFGIPSALSGVPDGTFNTQFAEGIGGGKNWFDTVDYYTSNWMLPLGGMGIALFTVMRVTDPDRRREYEEGSKLGKLAGAYMGWMFLLRFLVPVAIIAVIGYKVELYGFTPTVDPASVSKILAALSP